ncbi:alpha-glucosidase [Thermococcus sp. MV5]|uniref:alpha-glucosidase n=1 Tax=Thermococcus sp. MV5 TaxID=1638272 RepID=UPI00143A031D|nr:alpha-glucosidase [Thermococcus sp. MV5]NJE26933.1 alpha-glucosidase [Thermococcus sp. MV5]
MKSPELLRETANVLEEIEEKIKKLTSLSPRKKQNALNKIQEAKENFRKMAGEVVIDNEELAEFFLKRAVRLKNATNNKSIEKLGEKEYMKDVEAMLRYSRAIPYDFAGYMKYVNRAYKAYVWGMISFFVVTAFLPVEFKITSLILLIPILLSLLSLRKRGHTGLMLAFAALPIPMITGALAVRAYLDVFISPTGLQEAAQGLGVSPSTAQVIAGAMILFGIAELMLLSYALYMFYKHRHAFL